VDLDFQHRVTLKRREEIVWGFSYRFTDNQNQGKGVFNVQPMGSHDHLFSGFVQNQIEILKALRVTIGTKLEHNDFSGSEVQPSARIAWDFRTGQTFWASISKAARVPTRLERDIAVDASN